MQLRLRNRTTQIGKRDVVKALLVHGKSGKVTLGYHREACGLVKSVKENQISNKWLLHWRIVAGQFDVWNNCLEQAQHYSWDYNIGWWCFLDHVGSAA